MGESVDWRLASLTTRVREASRAGEIVRVDAAQDGALEKLPSDITPIHEGQQTYLFSTLHMSRRYAEQAARAAAGNALQLIAEAVRWDSATYPRPTPIGLFAHPPFNLTAERAMFALKGMAMDPAYEDIRQICASDGTLFLFSATFLDPSHAVSLAEWLAVGRLDNP